MPITRGFYTMASDGTRFYDEAGKAEALAHEETLAQKDQIERFLASKTWERGQETRARGIIGEFVEFQRVDAETVLDRVAGVVEDGLAGDFLGQIQDER